MRHAAQMSAISFGDRLVIDGRHLVSFVVKDHNSQAVRFEMSLRNGALHTVIVDNADIDEVYGCLRAYMNGELPESADPPRQRTFPPADACVVCFEERELSLYLPCGHRVCCTSCPRLPKCPVCREPVDEVMVPAHKAAPPDD